MRILILEDKFTEVEILCDQLCSDFNLSEQDLKVVACEMDFHEGIDDIVAWCPTIAVLDVMTLWRHPGEDAIDNRPEEVREDGYHYAGLRCAKLLRQAMQDIPIIFFTIVSLQELEKRVTQIELLAHNAFLVAKGHDTRQLTETIRKLLNLA